MNADGCVTISQCTRRDIDESTRPPRFFFVRFLVWLFEFANHLFRSVPQTTSCPDVLSCSTPQNSIGVCESVFSTCYNYRSDDEDTSNCPKPSKVVDSRRCPRCDRRKTGVNAAAVGDEERSRWLLSLRDGLDVSLATVANLIRKTEAAEQAAKNAGRTVVLVVQDGDDDDDDDGCCGCCRPGAGGAGPLTLSSRQSVDKQCEHSPLPPSPLTSSPLPPSPCLCSGPADVASAKVAAPTKATSAKVADARLPTRASGAFRSKSWCCTGGPSVVTERLTALTDLTPEGRAEREWCADCGTDNDDDHGGRPRCHWVAAGAVARSTSDDGTRRARPDRPKRARPINWIEVNKRRVSCHSGKRAPPGKRQKAPVPRPLPRPLW